MFPLKSSGPAQPRGKANSHLGDTTFTAALLTLHSQQASIDIKTAAA
jgi:hypothetical protein